MQKRMVTKRMVGLMVMLVGVAYLNVAFAETNATAAVGSVKEPGPMGALVMKAMRAANTGDFTTAVACCKVRNNKPRPVSESDKLKWNAITESGTLDFSEGKTHVRDESAEADDKGLVCVDCFGTGPKKHWVDSFNLIKQNGEWKIVQ